MGSNSRKKSKLAQSDRDPGEDRECGLCGMPQAASEFSVRSTPSPNCRRCERAYNMLHFHERLSMPIVRGNIRALGGPGLLVSIYKREGLKGLDLNQMCTQRRSKRSTRSDGPAEESTQTAGSDPKVEDEKPAVPLQQDCKASAKASKPPEAGEDEKPSKGKECDVQVNVKVTNREPAKHARGDACERPAPPPVNHSKDDLDLIGKHGGIKIIETDLGKRFVYKRKRAED